jgi:hypothetical protein
MGSEIMTNPTIKIHDTQSNEIVEREMTDQEIADLNPEIIHD